MLKSFSIISKKSCKKGATKVKYNNSPKNPDGDIFLSLKVGEIIILYTSTFDKNLCIFKVTLISPDPHPTRKRGNFCFFAGGAGGADFI